VSLVINRRSIRASSRFPGGIAGSFGDNGGQALNQAGRNSTVRWLTS
jgi:hypothetical protein